MPQFYIAGLCAFFYFLFCIACRIDTGLFVYMSLSQTLLSELCALLLGAMAVWHAWRKKEALADAAIFNKSIHSPKRAEQIRQNIRNAYTNNLTVLKDYEKYL